MTITEKMENTAEEKTTKHSNDSACDESCFQAGAMTDTFESLVVHREQNIFSHVRQPRRVHWAVAWSDLMMTMFILFAVMFIYQAAHRDFRYGEPKETQAEKTSAGKTEAEPGEKGAPDDKSAIKVEMAKSEKRPKESIRLETFKDLDRFELREDQTLRIILPADLLFDTGKADLKPQAMNSLRDVAEAIQKSDDVVNVVGHTDNVPIHSEQFATNWELSAIRASRVARFLIEEMKIPAERFFISGYSYHQPMASNDTDENRQKNRRVEVVISKRKL